MKGSITWVGLDAHKNSIQVAVLEGPGHYREWELGNEERKVRLLARKLVKQAGDGEVRVCYEAGPCGYVLKRQLESAAPQLVCEVVAPSLIPKKSGERVKTDRRDARKLAEYLAAGLLTEVHPPNEEQESVRDLTRCRLALKADLMRARHRLSKFLLRRGLHFHGTKKAWSKKHHEWLGTLSFALRADQVVFEQYLLSMQQLRARIEEVEVALKELAEQPGYREAVGRLRCFRGIDTVAALTLLAEVHDFRRFGSPLQLMSYLGLTPSEHSSGEKQRRGAITKAGNSRARKLLVEIAWHYRHRPGVGAVLRKRQQGQPPEVIAVADKAQQRLCRRYRRLTEAGKPYNKAVTAVARELVGFLWAAMQQPETA
jgi:transposase